MGVSAYKLAKDISVPLTRITKILAGERAVTADTALRLARYFGVSERFWVDLQSSHDIDVIKRALGMRSETEVRRREAA